MKKGIIIASAFFALFLCSCHKNSTEKQTSEPQTEETKDSLGTVRDSLNKDGIDASEAIEKSNAAESKITKDMAYEGVNNYCHSTYDWSIAEKNPSIMYVTMGEETESEYEVIFRSYTGAFVYFYVDKASGKTRLVEYVPTLDVKSEAGTIELFDYIEKK